MAEIANPLSTAMKARAKAAIDALGDDTESYTARTPRQLRSLILRQDDSDSVRTAMASEGWFEPVSGSGFSAASNTAVDVS